MDKEKMLETPIELVCLSAYSQEEMSYKIGVFLTENPEGEMFDEDPVETLGYWTCWMMRPPTKPIPEWAKPSLKEKWKQWEKVVERREREDR